jgi:preprotein translocase subunit SecY
MDTINRVGVDLVADKGLSFRLLTIAMLTAGSMLLMWIGDQITDRGIGNGTSMVITIGIVSSLPGALIQGWNTFVGNSEDRLTPIILVVMIAFLLIVVAATIAITQAQRKISVQYAKRVVGRKVYGGQTQYMPLKVNYAGVMPIIFAQAILLFPATIVNMAFPTSKAAQEFANFLAVGWFHYFFIALMIFFFSYFWVAMQFQPTQIAEDLKKYGGYIPGVRPGKPTADFLDHTMSRLTFAGAIFLALIAVLPQLLQERMNVPFITASFFGGTSLLIIVGVVLDTMRQVETHLIQRHYDGFLRKGKIRGRFERGTQSTGQTVSSGTLVWIWVGLSILILIGVTAFFAGSR